MAHAAVSGAVGFVALLAASGAASGEPTFPFAKSVEIIDYRDDGEPARFATVVEKAAANSFVYIDWSFKGAGAAEIFGGSPPEPAASAPAGSDAQAPEAAQAEETAKSDERVCEEAQIEVWRSGAYTLDGKPDSDNNHLLFNLDLKIGRNDPFAHVGCEYVAASHGLRVRGFFHVYELGTATANNFQFVSVVVPAYVVPRDFFTEEQKDK